MKTLMILISAIVKTQNMEKFKPTDQMLDSSNKHYWIRHWMLFVFWNTSRQYFCNVMTALIFVSQKFGI